MLSYKLTHRVQIFDNSLYIAILQVFASSVDFFLATGNSIQRPSPLELLNQLFYLLMSIIELYFICILSIFSAFAQVRPFIQLPLTVLATTSILLLGFSRCLFQDPFWIEQSAQHSPILITNLYHHIYLISRYSLKATSYQSILQIISWLLDY